MSKHESVVVTTVPPCDFCSRSAGVDGKTVQGPWANMCDQHFGRYGVGLGLGQGQKLLLKTGNEEDVT